MQEIERKFLVKNDDFKMDAYTHSEIKQGYLNSNPDRAVRIRIKNEEGYLTIKGRSNSSGTTRFEWEKQLSKEEAEALFELCEPGTIIKRRYLVKAGIHTYEVDVFEGNNKIGKNVSIGPNCYLKDSVLGDDVKVLANTVIEDSIVGKGCSLGPFSRIRGGTEMETGSELGNFVEANRSQIGPSSKAKHLAYLGDAELGRKVNIGAGTITCNYDGKKKHKTKMEDEVFIGSNSSLVAPVTLKKGSYTGAGSVITKNVKAGELAIGRARQKNLRKK